MRKWLKPFMIAGFLAWIYYPTFLWMIDRWFAKDSYFGHGFLIPLVVLYWVIKKQKTLSSIKLESDGAGFWLIGLGAVMQIVASALRFYFLSAFSFVILLFGIAWFLCGRKIIREIWFPICFLFLMIPLPLLVISQTALYMKFFVSEVSIFFLNAIGITAVRLGSYIQMPKATVLIGDPCSGLRSFLAFLCLGLVFAYDGKFSKQKKLFLAVIGLPLAIVSNVIRVFALSFLGELYGTDFVAKWIHDASGYVVFVFAFIILMAIRKKMEGVYSAQSA